jgi:hypothetical protein
LGQYGILMAALISVFVVGVLLSRVVRRRYAPDGRAVARLATDVTARHGGVRFSSAPRSRAGGMHEAKALARSGSLLTLCLLMSIIHWEEASADAQHIRDAQI